MECENEFKVIFSYKPQAADELELKVGDIITNVEYLEAGWCKGILNKTNIGVFPDNFVEKLSKSKIMNPQTELNGILNNSAASSVNNNNNENTDIRKRLCRVTFDYSPQHEDELGLNEGDIVTVYEEVEEGWWKGNLKGKVGMFPSNFVEEMDNADINLVQASNPYPDVKMLDFSNQVFFPKLQNISHSPDSNLHDNLVSPSSAFTPVQPINNLDKTDGLKHSKNKINLESPVTGTNTNKDNVNLKNLTPVNIGFSKIMNENKTETHSTPRISTSLNHFSPKEQNLSPISPPQLPPKPIRELARALYPYTSEHEDELNLQEGEIIVVLNKDLDDKGWWRGELNGRIGVFPDNFVHLISAPVDHEVKPPRPVKRPNSHIPEPSVKQTNNTDQINSPIIEKTGNTNPPAINRKPKIENSTPPSSKHESLEPSLSVLREARLRHLDRPKGPSNRRPPSQVFKGKKKSVGDDDDDILNSELKNGHSDHLEDGENLHNLSNGYKTPEPTPEKASNYSKEKSPPWLKELLGNQRSKRLSGVMNDSDGPLNGNLSPQSSTRVSLLKNDSTAEKGTTLSSSPPTKPAVLHKKPLAPPVPSNRLSDPSEVEDKNCHFIPATKSNSIPRQKNVNHNFKETSDKEYKDPVNSKETSDKNWLNSKETCDKERVNHKETSDKNWLNSKENSYKERINSKETSDKDRINLKENERLKDTFKESDKETKNSPSDFELKNTNRIENITNSGIDPSVEKLIKGLRKDFNAKIESIEKRVEEQKASFTRQIKILTSDLDAERKQRACLEIEVDRLTKISSATFAQV